MYDDNPTLPVTGAGALTIGGLTLPIWIAGMVLLGLGLAVVIAIRLSTRNSRAEFAANHPQR